MQKKSLNEFNAELQANINNGEGQKVQWARREDGKLDLTFLRVNRTKKDMKKSNIYNFNSKEEITNDGIIKHNMKIAKKNTDDLVFFVEDDYLHFEPMMEEMIASYERISSQLSNDIFMCPADYPYLYMNNQKTNILIGNKRHWRPVNETLCTFMTSKELLEKYWDNFYKTCLDRHDPFERYINDIYNKEICVSPLKSLSVHFTNINSSYGLSPFIDYKKLWDESK